MCFFLCVFLGGEWVSHVSVAEPESVSSLFTIMRSCECQDGENIYLITHFALFNTQTHTHAY